MTNRANKSSLEFDVLKKFFEYSVEEAARSLSRTPAEIRAHCRSIGISWPRADIDRYRKQIRHSEELLSRVTSELNKDANSANIQHALESQIKEFHEKIELLYKDPEICSKNENETRDRISHPYKRRTRDTGILSDNEKERYRYLFSNEVAFFDVLRLNQAVINNEVMLKKRAAEACSSSLSESDATTSTAASIESDTSLQKKQKKLVDLN